MVVGECDNNREFLWLVSIVRWWLNVFRIDFDGVKFRICFFEEDFVNCFFIFLGNGVRCWLCMKLCLDWIFVGFCIGILVGIERFILVFVWVLELLVVFWVNFFFSFFWYLVLFMDMFGSVIFVVLLLRFCIVGWCDVVVVGLVCFFDLFWIIDWVVEGCIFWVDFFDFFVFGIIICELKIKGFFEIDVIVFCNCGIFVLVFVFLLWFWEIGFLLLIKVLFVMFCEFLGVCFLFLCEDFFFEFLCFFLFVFFCISFVFVVFLCFWSWVGIRELLCVILELVSGRLGFFFVMCNFDWFWFWDDDEDGGFCDFKLLLLFAVFVSCVRVLDFFIIEILFFYILLCSNSLKKKWMWYI